MLDTRLHDWLARLPRNGPWLVSLVLATLIAVELARMAVSLLGGSPLQSPISAPNRMPATTLRPGIDVQSVVSAHLLGTAAGAGSLDPANAPNSTSNLLLAGTIATQDPKRGIAIISDGGPSKVYSVGDAVGGASLYSVYLDRVLLNRAGSLETLLLPHVLPARAPPPVAQRASAIDQRTLASVENIRRMVAQDPGLLNEVMRTVASYDNKAGKLRGFRAYPGRNRQAFASLGLRPGDLVTAINGTPLDDPQRSQEVLNTIQSSNQATVTIERAGEKQDITLNIAQVAAQASKVLENGGNNGAAINGGSGAMGAADPAAPVVPGTPAASAPAAAGGPSNENSN